MLNASPMIVLARADYLDLVPKLVSWPVIPRAVAAEIRAGETDDPAAEFLGQPSWLTVVDLNPALSPLAIWRLVKVKAKSSNMPVEIRAPSRFSTTAPPAGLPLRSKFQSSAR